MSAAAGYTAFSLYPVPHTHKCPGRTRNAVLAANSENNTQRRRVAARYSLRPCGINVPNGLQRATPISVSRCPLANVSVRPTHDRVRAHDAPKDAAFASVDSALLVAEPYGVEGDGGSRYQPLRSSPAEVLVLGLNQETTLLARPGDAAGARAAPAVVVHELPASIRAAVPAGPLQAGIDTPLATVLLRAPPPAAPAAQQPADDASSSSSANAAEHGRTAAAAQAVSSASVPAATTAQQPQPADGSTAAPASPPVSPAAQAPGGWAGVLSARLRGVSWVKVWALAILSVAYIHQAVTGFALPAMLPMISNELHLSDLQGALLTTGYSYLYAVALVPIGLLADKMSRPKLLAVGLGLWSVLTCVASGSRSFTELILARVGFAAAQGVQNPVCFSLIPELFPASKNLALSLYNCAIYVGRALSFGAVLLARHLHDNDQAHLAARGGLRVETRLDHLDRADLHSLSIMHTSGDMAAAAPDHEFIFPLAEYGGELPDAAWRQVLRWIAVPGFIIAVGILATMKEPRQAALEQSAALPQQQPQTELVAGRPAAAGSAAADAAQRRPLHATMVPTAQPAPPLSVPAPVAAVSAAPAASAPAAAAAATPMTRSGGGPLSGIWALLRSRGFMQVTMAAAMNDVGSYALIAWQSTFYERVYGLPSSAYAPVLAMLLPIGGIIGGVGGGFLADVLSRTGRRWMVTGCATLMAGPCLAASCLAPTPELSYAALLVGFAMSEAWRAPAAVMARGMAPSSMGSSSSAVYLCLRNLVGGLGPLGVAGLIGLVGLQKAMLLVPAMYVASGLLFLLAEQQYDTELAAKQAAEAKAA